MKKYSLIILLCLLFSRTVKAQALSSAVFITKTYSENGNFYIKCTPYDNEEPSLKGKAEIYNKDDQLIYSVERGFNGITNHNFLSISNDGNIIAYIIAARPNENVDGLKTVSIYQKGKLAKSFTQKEITGCDPQNDRCPLLYSNDNEVIDYEKSKAWTKDYHKTYKDGISEQEKFLNEHPIVSWNDSIFLVDPQKRVHIIDLKNCKIARDVDFSGVYSELKGKSGKDTTTYERFETPIAPDESAFPNLLNGDTTGQALADFIGLKAMRLNDDYSRYKVYQINIGAYISRDGTVDIQKINADKKLPLDSIRMFFEHNKFNMSFLPADFDRWYFRYFFWVFRNKSDVQSILEKSLELKDMEIEHERRMTADSINGVYIPRNLGECFTELDKLLPNVTKSEITALKSHGEMIRYHLGLGTFIRNRWGLWGGSRLVKYFQDHGVKGIGKAGPNPESVSTMILFSYYDWLKGDKNTGKEWEEKHPLVNK